MIYVRQRPALVHMHSTNRRLAVFVFVEHQEAVVAWFIALEGPIRSQFNLLTCVIYALRTVRDEQMGSASFVSCSHT